MTHRSLPSLLLAFVGLIAACSPEAFVDEASTAGTTPFANSADDSTVPLATSTAPTTSTTAGTRMIESLGPDGYSEDRLVARLVPEVLEDQLHPLVIVLHAYGGVADAAIGDFGLRDAAAKGGWIVLAPSGLVDSIGNQYWNATPTCCDRDHSGVGDVEYLRQIILAALIQYPVEPSQVFVIGGSNGGFMAYQLACHASDLVAAIVVSAATEANSEQACQPRYPVSVFHVHGKTDQAVKFYGGELSLLLERIAPYPSAEATVRRWAVRNGCPTEDPYLGLTLGATRGEWLNCGLGTSVRFVWLDQGHDLVEPRWLVDQILEFVGEQVRAPLRPVR